MAAAEKAAAEKAAAEAQEQALNEKLNRAITAREKDLAKKFAKEQDEREAKILARLEEAQKAQKEAFDAMLAKLTPAPKDDPKDKAPAPKLDEAPEFLAMKKAAEDSARKLAALEKRAAEDAKEKAALLAQQRTENLKQTAIKALAAVGIKDPEAAEDALTVLLAGGHIAYGEDEHANKVLFVPADGLPQDLPTGLAAWAKTPRARRFLPPQNPGGSGGGTGRRPQINAGQPGQRPGWDTLRDEAWRKHETGDDG
jgi:colicin import membrane protein